MVELLVPQEEYLKAGVHIGTKFKSGDMKQFIYKARNDQLYVLDLKKVDERIKAVAKMLAQYKPGDVLITASRAYAEYSAGKFCEINGCRLVTGRFSPGLLTNPKVEGFMEPKVLMVTDPRGEKNAIKEAGKIGIPVIAMCDTNAIIKYLDLVLPCNNKGKKSLGLLFWLLGREMAKAKGEISSNEEWKYPLEDFESKLELGPVAAPV